MLFAGQRSDASQSSLMSRQGSREDEAVPQQAASVKESHDSPMRRSESKMKAILRDEVLINAQKFKIQV